MKVRIISVKGEAHKFNEDFGTVIYDSNNRRLKAYVVDFSNRTGGPYADREIAAERGEEPETLYPGGFIGAYVAKKVVESTDATGHELIEQMNAALARKYKELAANGHEELLRYEEERALCFAGFIAHCTVTPEIMTVTALGDVSIIADGKLVAGREQKSQHYLNELRRIDIRVTHDPKGAYERLLPVIRQVYTFRNDPNHPLYAAVIDGTESPAEMIESLSQPTPRRITIFSDGHVDPSKRKDRPVAVEDYTIEGLESMLTHVHEVDPDRCGEYPAVGSLLDDRTAIEIADMDDWARFEEEFVEPIFRR